MMKAKTTIVRKIIDLYLLLPIKRKISMSFMLIFLVSLLLLLGIISKMSSNIVVNKTFENTVQNLILVSEKLDMLCGTVESYSKVVISNIYVQDLLSKTIDRPITFEENTRIKNVLNNIIFPKTIMELITYIPK